MVDVKLRYEHLLFAVCCVFIFSLLVAVQINVPMQSDDYSYLSLGGNIEGLINHYLSWSGRLAADLTSSTLLSLFQKNIYSALNSLALVSLLLLCTMLPSFIFNEKSTARDCLTFLILFFVYWIANPNLGQTTFWIVGSANYLWTTLYTLMFFCIFSLAVNRSARKIYIPVIFLCGFAGGITNEHTGWIAFAFVLFSYLFHRFEKNQRQIRYIYASGFLGGLLGWLVLIFSPGNINRANKFQEWYSKGIFERIDIHLYSRLPSILSSFIFAFILIILILAMQMAFTSPKYSKPTSDNKLFMEKPKVLGRWFLFFLVCGFLSSLMLVGAPAPPPRTGNGTLVLFLIAASLLMHSHNREFNKGGACLTYYGVVFSFALVYFIPSYYLIHFSMKRTHYQEQVRNTLIVDAVKSGATTVSIPDFRFSKLIKFNDRFDLYHNGPIMARYHGGHLKDITVSNIWFDYGTIIENDYELPINKEIYNKLALNKIIFYSEPNQPFFKNSQWALFEFNAEPSLNLTKERKILIHFKKSNDAEDIKIDMGRPHTAKIGNKFYYAHPLSDDLLNGKIKSVQISVYSNTGKDSDILIDF